MHVIETLFMPLRQDLLQWRGKNILFLNAVPYEDLKDAKFYLQQYFKSSLPQSKPEIPNGMMFDAVLLLFPKNIVEGRYQMARGLELLTEGGVFVCAADNKAGGARLEKIFAEFGFLHVQSISKHKARVVWGRAADIQKNVMQAALIEGAEQNILDGTYLSQPGVFGWDKIDQGSALLIKNLPQNLKGKGADFGCGYGYLSRYVLEKMAGVQSLLCADADYRAVELCRKNLENFSGKTSFAWCDLTKPPKEKNLDFIVMNPPFHEGKSLDLNVGADFIRQASESLRPGGMLWMVANTHLPYEPILSSTFSAYHKLYEGQGFKVYKATK